LFDEFEYFFFQQRRQPFPRVVYDFPILLNIFCHVFLNVCTCFVYPMKERRTSLNTINLFFKNELSSTFNSSWSTPAVSRFIRHNGYLSQLGFSQEKKTIKQPHQIVIFPWKKRWKNES
jgi:hypothetical protein